MEIRERGRHAARVEGLLATDTEKAVRLMDGAQAGQGGKIANADSAVTGPKQSTEQPRRGDKPTVGHATNNPRIHTRSIARLLRPPEGERRGSPDRISGTFVSIG